MGLDSMYKNTNEEYKIMRKLKPENLGRLGEEGYYVLIDRAGTMPSGETYVQVRILKRYNGDLIKIIQTYDNGTAFVQFAKDNHQEIINISEIKTFEKPLNSWD
jgi:hypothetical protein